ncbi:MAG TPA: LysO family transporter, partial [Clostridiales bacterium]|nr:LysO family transporter [Clostridiales bacterium]
MRSSIVIIIFFALGIILGYSIDERIFVFNDDMSTYALHFLLFLIGISIGADLKVFRIIKKLHYRI